jgi:hypothetical protein
MRLVSAAIRKAQSILEKARQKNMKLADYDERVRDPQIKRLKKIEKKK